MLALARVPELLSALTPLEVEQLTLFFSGHVDASFGVRSALGGQLERQRLGLGRPQSSPELREASAADRALFALLEGRLERADLVCPDAPPAGSRVLHAYLMPHDVGRPVLPLHYRLGPVMLLTRSCGDANETMVRRADADGRRLGPDKKPLDLESADWIRAMRVEAERRVIDAAKAFASTRPPRKAEGEGQKERRPQGAALFAGRTDEQGRVVFATPNARRAAGGSR